GRARGHRATGRRGAQVAAAGGRGGPARRARPGHRRADRRGAAGTVAPAGARRRGGTGGRPRGGGAVRLLRGTAARGARLGGARRPDLARPGMAGRVGFPGDARGGTGTDPLRRTAAPPRDRPGTGGRTRLVKLLVISDTHVPARARDLPAELWRAVDAADLVIHAGDWVDVALLDTLSARSAALLGVYGNNDGPALRARLPEVA